MGWEGGWKKGCKSEEDRVRRASWMEILLGIVVFTGTQVLRHCNEVEKTVSRVRLQFMHGTYLPSFYSG